MGVLPGDGDIDSGVASDPRKAAGNSLGPDPFNQFLSNGSSRKTQCQDSGP